MDNELLKHIKEQVNEAPKGDKVFKPMPQSDIDKQLQGKLSKIKKIGLKMFQVERAYTEYGRNKYWFAAINEADARRMVENGEVDAGDSDMDDYESGDILEVEETGDPVSADEYVNYARGWDGKVPKDVEEAKKDDKTFQPMSDKEQEKIAAERPRPILEVIRELVANDDEDAEGQQVHIERAIEKNDCDALLVAICGYGWEFLKKFARHPGAGLLEVEDIPEAKKKEDKTFQAMSADEMAEFKGKGILKSIEDYFKRHPGPDVEAEIQDHIEAAVKSFQKNFAKIGTENHCFQCGAEVEKGDSWENFGDEETVDYQCAVCFHDGYFHFTLTREFDGGE